MSQYIELSLEQQFELRAFQDHVQNLSADQSRGLLVEVYQAMLMKDAYYKQALQQQWGIDSAPKL